MPSQSLINLDLLAGRYIALRHLVYIEERWSPPSRAQDIFCFLLFEPAESIS